MEVNLPENEWVTLLEVFDRLQAEIIKEALDAQGIPAQLFQEGISHYLYPVTGPMGKIEICVPYTRLKDAREWLNSYQNGDLIDNDSEESNPGQ